MNTTKTLMLAALASLSIGAGAAMAQEVDAQFLKPSQIPTPTYQWLPSASGVQAANPAATQAGSVTTLFGASHNNVPVYDGSDGGGA
jgi:hypothetical protein